MKNRRGFTLIELLIVVVIIGVLSTVVIPNGLVAIQKSKQKNTMKDIASVSTAIMGYVTDNGVAPAQAGTYEGGDSFYAMVCPLHIKVLPLKDSWGNPFRVWCGLAATEYGISDSEADDFLVASFGRDNEQDDFTFNPGSPEVGVYSISSLEDFDNDLIMWNAAWIRGPAAGSGGSGGGGCSGPSRP